MRVVQSKILLASVFLLVVSLESTTTTAFQPQSHRKVGLPGSIPLSYKIQHRSLCSQGARQNANRQQQQQQLFSRIDATKLHSFPAIGESFFLTRVVFLRALSFVYGIAFLIARNQAKALIGDNGIAPARRILDAAEARGRKTATRRQAWLDSTLSEKPLVSSSSREELSPWFRFKNSLVVKSLILKINRNARFQHWRERLWDRQDGMGHPVTTLLWLAKDRSNLNRWLDGICNWGLGLSLVVLVTGAANVPLLMGLWICQRSLMAVGGPFWGFGWEPQLAELGFHALFLVPFMSLDPICLTSPPSKLVLFLIRWHLFRIMMGAGLIKIRSDDIKWKWPHFSAMNYFYETQPVPNPLTRYLHWMPKWWHKSEVLVNHIVELVAPWMLLAPTASWRRTGGLIQMIFQAVLISSGNLSFLNWLTIVPAITCLDDSVLCILFSREWRDMASEAFYFGRCSCLRNLVSVLFTVWIGYLSIPVVRNLLSKYQVMNGSFGPLRLINTYGAFGNVDEVRYEFIVSAASSYEGPWKEYEFKVKPGSVHRSPRFLSPYHYRLDWQFWIASTLQNLSYSPWMYSFLLKVLERNSEVMSLLASDPFLHEEEPPRYIRIDKYRYEFNKRTHGNDKDKAYWKREFVGRVYPRQGVATIESLKEMIDRS